MKMDRMVYLYENSLEELLFLIDFLIGHHLVPLDIQNEETYEQNLIDKTFKVKKNSRENFYFKWVHRTNSQVMNVVKDVYFSLHPKKELVLYYFLINACKYKDTILERRNLKCVLVALQVSHYVHQEIHKWKGFLRFQEIQNGILYGKMAPQNNVIYPLAKHFQKRFANEVFVIHDVTRMIFAVYDRKKLYFFKGDKSPCAKLTFCEKQVEELWKTFFHTIGIQERKNERCQRNFMPKKYWRYMIEMEDYL